MSCFDEGTLRAYLDRELPTRQSDAVARHLGACAGCRERLAEVEENARVAGANLTALAPSVSDTPSHAQARAEFRRRLNEEQPVRIGERIGAALSGLRAALSPRRLATAAVPLALAAALVFTPAGSYAQDFLAAFRVQEVQAIQIDPAMLPGMPEPEELGTLQLSAKPELRSVTIQEAGRASGLTLLGPSAVPDGFTKKPLAFVSQPIDGSFTYDYAKVAAYYQKKGLTATPPAEIAGLTIKGSASPIAVFFYADQESLNRLQQAASMTPTKEEARAMSQSNPRFLTLVQTRTPSIEVPNNVDVNKLRAEVLASGVVPAELAAQLAAIENWQTTLPVPVVDGSSKDVTVDGAHGVLMAVPEGGAALIWQKGDVSYALIGTVSEAELLAAANSLAVVR